MQGNSIATAKKKSQYLYSILYVNIVLNYSQMNPIELEWQHLKKDENVQMYTQV